MQPTNHTADQQHRSHQGFHDDHSIHHGDQGHPHVHSRVLSLNVLLLGEAQSGRSSVGNVLIGGGEFRAGQSGSLVTGSCDLRCRTFSRYFRRKGAESDLRLRVMDTPPLPPPERGERGGREGEIRGRVCEQFVEGVHVVVLVVRADVPVRDTHLTLSTQAMLGPGWNNHALLVLTHADSLKGAGLKEESYLSQASDSLRALIDMVGGRCLFLNGSADWPEIEGRPLRDCLLSLSVQNRHTALTLDL